MSQNLPAQRNNNAVVDLKSVLQRDSVKNRISERLGKKAGTFMTSLLELSGDDKNLQLCDPNLVIKEAMKAASLDLPLNKNLGFAYVIAYKEKGTPSPQFQMGYKGFIQLAIRTGQYKHLNADAIYEGETVDVDRIRGTLQITGRATSEKAIGYFAYMELVNGFEKAVFWPVEKVEAHARRFSKSYGKGFSPWSTDFDAMAKKTMIMRLVPKYGPMSIEMTQALDSDRGDFKGFGGNGEGEDHYYTPSPDDLTAAINAEVVEDVPQEKPRPAKEAKASKPKDKASEPETSADTPPFDFDVPSCPADGQPKMNSDCEGCTDEDKDNCPYWKKK